ncbi:MAG: glycerophosphodiester phosphodiesterase [Sporichthyaceae bacterium]
MVEIIAHRGSREGTSEHTLAAYRLAIADGADGLECDVRLTADRHLVCLHDRSLDFVSDSRGIVSTMQLAELAEVQFGTRRAWRMLDRYRGTVPAAHTVCTGPEDHLVVTLRQLIELATTAGRPVGLAIETKHPTRYRGDVETALAALLGEFGLLHPARDLPPGASGAQLGTRPAVRVMSFAAVSLRRMRALAPDLDLVYLMGRIPPHLRDGSLPEGVRAAGIDVKIVRKHPEYVAKAHALGNAVYCWTVNTPADADACLAAGVDALITDRPAFMRSHVLGAHVTGSA